MMYLSKPSVICNLGDTADTISAALQCGDQSALVKEANWLDDRAVYLGKIRRELLPIPVSMSAHNCRNNQILRSALQPLDAQIQTAITRYGQHRVGVILGSSTSGIASSEAAIKSYARTGQVTEGYHYQQQIVSSPTDFVQAYYGLTGPAMTISTACSSSAKAFASASRWLAANVCDVVLVGGVDSLCQMTVAGFNALESLSHDYCQPFTENRDGINIGEACAVFLMSRESHALAEPAQYALRGCGETSDAYHISAPRPDGAGAAAAMTMALQQAGLEPSDIGYINLHGTATPKNDVMEAFAVASVGLAQTPMSSTKALTGHTLGAAGALEIAFCAYALSGGFLPKHQIASKIDDTITPLSLVTTTQAEKNLRFAMSNSFAFGGSNASVIIEKL